MSKIKIVTFNIRYATEGDGINNFIHRSGLIRKKIKAELPEIIAFQEVTDWNRASLEEMLPEYYFLGMMRSKKFDNEGLYFAVRKDAFEVIGFESVWLSPTPYEAGSRYPDQSPCPRICTMLYLRHRESNQRMRVYDLHLDHISEEAKVLGMQAALDFVDSYNAKEPLPTVILGDFNAEPTSDVISMVNARGDLIDVTADIPFTFHDYGRQELKIDYIFLSPTLADRVISVERWTDEQAGIYLSDHYPVCATLEC